MYINYTLPFWTRGFYRRLTSKQSGSHTHTPKSCSLWKQSTQLNRITFLWDSQVYPCETMHCLALICSKCGLFRSLHNLGSILWAAQKATKLSGTQLSAQRLQWQHCMNFPDVYTVGCADKLLKEYSAKTRNSREVSVAEYLQLLTTDPDVPVQARSEWYEKQMLLAHE